MYIIVSQDKDKAFVVSGIRKVVMKMTPEKVINELIGGECTGNQYNIEIDGDIVASYKTRTAAQNELNNIIDVMKNSYVNEDGYYRIA